jgi:thiol-disulfide isomerase/thioredoxin
MDDLSYGALRSQSPVRRVVISLAVIVAVATAVYATDRSNGQAVTAASVAAGTASGPAPKVGEPAPEFAATDLTGQKVTLASLRGRPVWINFWASWCPPCRAEAPDVEQAYRQARASGVVLLAVNFGEDAETARQYAETTGSTAVVLLDPDKAVASRYRVAGLPTHYFVDRSGVLRGMQVGGLSTAAILQRLSLITP